jgi:NodT family efflux transporter outer membrane factor (OMF) lipoprotein
MNKFPHGRRLAGLAAALLLAGCASTRGIAPEAQLRQPAVPQASTQAVAPVDAQWWREFGDRQLDALVEQALAGNPNLGVARARLRRAQAVSDAARGADLPQVNGSLDITRQRFTENGLYPKPLAGSIQDTATLQASTSWELDFFGKNEAALQATLGATRAAEADVAAARVVLAGNVARTYFQMVRVQEQLAVARRALGQREEQVGLVRQRVGAGLDTNLELRQSEGALPEARQQVEALQEQAQTTRNALAALVGSAQVPAVGALPAMATLRAPTVIGALPADLLGRRADVAPNGAWGPRCGCRSSTPAGCAPTCAARRPISMRRSKATTPPCWRRSTKRPMRSPACSPWAGSRASSARRWKPRKAPTRSRCNVIAPASAPT